MALGDPIRKPGEFVSTRATPAAIPPTEEEQWISDNINKYALWETAKDFTKMGHLKYAYDEEREKFSQMGGQKQVNKLLWDTAEDLGIMGINRIAKGFGNMISGGAQRFMPGVYRYLTRSRTLPGAVKKTVDTAKQSGAKAMDLIRKRRADIDKAMLDSEIFIKDVGSKLTQAEREALPFIREGIKDTSALKNIGREDLIPTVQNPSKALLEQTERVGRYYDEAHRFLEENWGDVGFVKDYVTHLWNVPKNKTKEAVTGLATKNPFLRQRSIPTFEEGISMGLEPKTTDITKLLKIYDQYKIKTAHNYNFAKAIKGMVDDDGNPLMMRIDKAPNDWVEINHPAFNRAMATGRAKVSVDGEAVSVPVLSKVPVKVHPDIAKEVKLITEQPFSHAAIQAYETINAFAKKGMLSVSFFHHFALTESAFSSGIGGKAAKLWNPLKLYRALKKKDYAIFAEQPLAKDAIEHGVTFGALEDVHRGIVNRGLEFLEGKTKNIPLVRYGTKGVRKANELWDQALWDYYHNTLKLWAYEENVVHGLKTASTKLGRSLADDEVTAVKQSMGQFVNDSFGGQNWELHKTLGNPKIRQMMHWTFLAPDWTLSTLRQAASPPLKGAALIARDEAANKAAGKALLTRGGAFWAKAGMYFNLIAQSVNYANTKKEYGKGRFTWDNSPGKELDIFIGRNDDGTERYLRSGKQFKEVLEWSLDPVLKLGAKLSPLLRESMRQVAAHDPGSGYPTEWADKDFWSTGGMKERAMSFAEMPIPFSLRPYVTSRPGNYMFTFPTSRGMTNYKAVDLFKRALKDKDRTQVERVYISALENELDAESLFKSANRAVKADITYDSKTLAKKIYTELREFSQQEEGDALRLYKERGILTPEVYQEYLKFKQKKRGVRLQQLQFGINTSGGIR